MGLYLHGVDETLCFPLEVGRHVLGRDASASLVIPDPSISQNHAEISIQPDGIITVRDLGSTNGTFLGPEKIQQSTLHIGQEIIFGNVRLKLDDKAADIVVPQPEVPAQPERTWMPDGQPACLLHPGVYAQYECEKCNHALCADCVRQVGLKGARPKLFCTNCSGLCHPLGRQSTSRKPGSLSKIWQTIQRFLRS